MLSLGSLFLAFTLLLGASAMHVADDTVNLGTAGGFAILTKSGVTTTGLTSVTGDIGTSPIASTAITGFSLILDSTTEFSTSSYVTGSVWAASYTSPTPSKMTTAISDMETAYTDAAGRVGPDEIELGAGNVEGLILAPGLYKWGTSVGFTDSLTFEGNATDVWILQISGDLTAASGAEVKFVSTTFDGDETAPKPEHIFWQVAGSTTVHTTAHMEGIILCATSIDFLAGSSLNGAALSKTAVTLDATTVVKPTST